MRKVETLKQAYDLEKKLKSKGKTAEIFKLKNGKKYKYFVGSIYEWYNL